MKPVWASPGFKFDGFLSVDPPSATLTGCALRFIVKPENICTLSKTQNLTSLARFPNLATLQRVNLIVGFTITKAS